MFRFSERAGGFFLLKHCVSLRGNAVKLSRSLSWLQNLPDATPLHLVKTAQMRHP